MYNGDDIKKRRAELQDNILKGFSLENGIEKARSGVYGDTAENRKLGRVGQKYGAEKKDGKTGTESKKKREIIGQAKSVMEALVGTNSKYNNPNKVKLDVTPKGNWRVFYNGKDTGVTIGQSVISDSVVEKMGWERHSAK